MRLSVASESSFAFTRANSTAVYRGKIDAEWNIGLVPHGGYMAAVVLDALCRHQANSARGHVDPAHLTIQFLNASSPGAYQIEISTVSISGRWTRLDLSLYQFAKDSSSPLLRLRSHALFTNLPELGEPAAPSATNITVMPNSITEFAQPYPFTVHPSECLLSGMPPIFNFKEQVRWSSGAGLDGTEKTLEWKGWVELVDEREDLRRSAMFMGFFGDLFRNGFERLPKAEQPAPGWLPTLHFAVEFKSKFPLVDTPLSKVAPRTVGVHAKTDFLHAGRYGASVEIWSAPGAIGAPRSDGGAEDWRSHGRILAVATQMALIVPSSVNERNKPKL